MKTIGKVIAAAAVVLAVFAGGCGDDASCASESPQVDTVPSCTATAGSNVSYKLRLCPTCNQTLTGCSVDMSDARADGGTIFLNPTVEACESAASCGPGCNLNPASCSFTAPAGAAPATTYTVLVFDAGTGGTKQGTLTIVTTGASCELPTS